MHERKTLEELDYPEGNQQQATFHTRFYIPTSGGRPSPGIEPSSLASPTLAGRLFTTSAAWEDPGGLQLSLTMISLTYWQLSLQSLVTRQNVDNT